MARHAIKDDKKGREIITSAKAKHQLVYKVMDEQGSIVLQLQDLIALGQGTVPNAPVETDDVEVRQRFVPVAASLDDEKQPDVNKYLAATALFTGLVGFPG